MINTYMNTRYLRQSRIANLSTLEQYQLFNEVQRAKREIRIEATVDLARHERRKHSQLANPNLGAKLDVYG